MAQRIRALGLRARATRKYKATTQSKHSLPVTPNRLGQDFTAKLPNHAWTSDITCLWTVEGWLYLTAVMGLYSRSVVGWAMAERMARELVVSALTMAAWRPGGAG